MIEAWPTEALNEQCQTFFLHCVLRVANETSHDCRVVLVMCLTRLFSRIGTKEYLQLADYVVQWLKPRDDVSVTTTRMACASAQVCRIMLEKRPNPLKGGVGRELVRHALEHVARESRTVDEERARDDDDEFGGVDGGGEGGVTNLDNIVEHNMTPVWRNKEVAPCPTGATWEVALHSMRALEMSLKVSYLTELTSTSVMDRRLPSVMLHTQHGMRIGASRLVGHVLALKDASKKIDEDTKRLLLNRLCRQLEGSFTDTELTDTVVRNLVYLGRTMWEEQVKTYTVKKESKKRERGGSAGGGGGGEERRVVPMNWLFHRLSFLARKKRLDHDQERFELRATAVMQWMAALIQFDDQVTYIHTKTMLAPVFRLVNSERREVSNELRALAQELMEMIQASLKRSSAEEGTFLKLHEEVRSKVTEDKLERKRKRAQLKIVDPEAAAIYREQRKDAKKRNKNKKKMSDGYHKVRKRRRGNEDIL